MKWITFALTIATLAGLIAYTPPASARGGTRNVVEKGNGSS